MLSSFMGLFGNRESQRRGGNDPPAGAKPCGPIGLKLPQVGTNRRPPSAGGDEASECDNINDVPPNIIMNLAPLQKSDLESSMGDVASGVKPWDASSFKFSRTLQDAVRNHGRVDLMESLDSSLGKVAVKRMPNRWVRSGPQEFKEHYPQASEQPWCDIGLVQLLNGRKFPCVCRLLGVFRDSENTYVMTSLATEGDLFAWCDLEPRPGLAREKTMLPLVAQIFSGVRCLHDIGIAHRDLSLENILLTRSGNDGELTVKIIDFGMATIVRQCRREVRGKQSYQAPEMHNDDHYDAFLSDTFAIGVVLFAMAAQDYPWISTKRNTCQLFEYVSMFGFRRFLDKRKLRKGNGEHLRDVFSEPLVELLEGLLQIEPAKRFTLGESCWHAKGLTSVWDCKWISKDDNAKAYRDPHAVSSPPRCVSQSL